MENIRSEFDSRISMSSSDETKRFLSSDDMEPLTPRSSRRKMPWLSTGAVLAALNFALFTAAVAVWWHAGILSRSCPKLRKDHFEPDLLYDTKVTFQPHWYYGGPPSNHTDEMWQRLSPPGDGIVEVPNTFTTSLPYSLPAPNNPDTHKVYGVSMFHQLHCLNFLRFAYYPDTIESMAPTEIVAHRDHCLDYIRQAIMCAGDATFEPLTMVGINGMGAIHQCRNFERLFSWAYSHRSDKKEEGSGYKGGVVTHTPGHRNDFAESSDEMPSHHHHGSG